jgi:hypothetical protein
MSNRIDTLIAARAEAAARYEGDPLGHNAQLHAASDLLIEALISERWPTDLTQPLCEVLGMPNFQAGPIAHLFRAAGAEIPCKAEIEQAFVLHRFVPYALKAGGNWRDVAGRDIDMALARRAERASEQKGPAR